MSPEEAIRDPVFHLNLLVWMAKEQPTEGFRVRPLFSQHGFQLHYIEQPFPFPTELRYHIEKIATVHALEINRDPEPELTIQRPTDGSAIYFEAKAQRFSSASPNCKQAHGHLLACGPAFAEVYKPLQTALLDYVVPAGDSAEMRECLRELQIRLRSAELETGNYAVDGLSIQDSNLLYHLDQPLRELLPTASSEIAVMTDLDAETDPSPLLLVYSDEDCPNPARIGHYRRVFQNQVLANLLCTLHSNPPEKIIEINVRDLLLRTTNGVFSYLGRKRQKRMERLIFDNIYRRISNYWKERLPDKVKLVEKTLTLNLKNSSDRESILDWMENAKQTGFDDKKPNDNGQQYLIPPD